MSNPIFEELIKATPRNKIPKKWLGLKPISAARATRTTRKTVTKKATKGRL